MSMKRLDGLQVAALVTDGFEEPELTEPMKALRAAGAEVSVVAPHGGKVRAWNRGSWGGEYPVDVPLSEARAADFGALVIPGGVIGVDHLRMDARAVNLVRDFRVQGKPVAAICHAPWMIVQAGITQGLTLTSYPSLRTDVLNAGGHWVNEEVVESNGVVTSRNIEDLPAFIVRMVELFALAKKGVKVGEQTPVS